MQRILEDKLFNNFISSYSKFEDCYREFELRRILHTRAFDMQSPENWFGSAKFREIGHDFLCFGINGTGGLYCFWKMPDSDELPIIWLSDEGEGTHVIAKDFITFLQYLADRKEYSVQLETFFEFEELDEIEEEDHEKFVEWLTLEAGIELRPAEEIISESQRMYPDAYDIIKTLL